eukprot:5258964-Amphidinium_carterae.1
MRSKTLQELMRLVHMGYLMQFDSLAACQSYLCISPRLSKLGMVSKEQVAPDGASTAKRRLIFDGRQSG